MKYKEIKKYHKYSSDIFAISSRLAPYFTKLFLYTKITANQVSLLNLLFVIIPFFLISIGNYWHIVLGCFLLQIHIILDYADGPIARIKKTASFFGSYYEYIFHQFIPPILMIALSINSYRFFNNPIYLLLGCITVFFVMMSQQLKLKKDSIAYRNKKRLKLIKEEIENRKVKYYKIIEIFNSFSHLMGIFLILAMLNIIQYAIIFYSVFYISLGIMNFIIEFKIGGKEMNAKEKAIKSLEGFRLNVVLGLDVDYDVYKTDDIEKAIDIAIEETKKGE